MTTSPCLILQLEYRAPKSRVTPLYVGNLRDAEVWMQNKEQEKCKRSRS